MTRALAAALLLAAAPGGGSASPGVSPGSAAGTYRLAGTARVSASPLPGQALELRADAVLRPGAGPRAIRARLSAQGHACELEGSLEPGGGLSFEAGQRCALDLDGPEARGKLEARLRSGGGRLEGRDLSLELRWELTGTVSLRTSGGVQVPGLGLEVPDTWAPPTSVRGEARATAAGTRDDSRAGGR